MSGYLETLASYVPPLIARRFIDSPDRFTEPQSERLTAAVLFADISGFTQLTEMLAQRGPAGEEELTRLLNDYFGQLISIIGAHGGEVVKFAGDALLAIWPVGDDDLTTVTRRAIRCSLIVQATLHDFQAAETVRLSLQIGIGAGNLFNLYLGGKFGRWEFLITGPPLTQMSHAEDLAQPGQVVLSPEAWTLVEDTASGQPLPAGHVLLKEITRPLNPKPVTPPIVPPAVAAALRSYVPAAIRERLDAEQSGWLAELRRVTVLFINLPDLKHGTPLKQAQAAMLALQTAIYHYEGSINKLNVDDKGTTLVAALGLPPLSHEDDAVRGVQAALEAQAALDTMGLHTSIGVTSGRAFCGSVGSETRREYTMIGDVVNLSARLMQAAGGGILCDSVTYTAASNQINFEAPPPITVKGKQQPVAVYRPRSQISSSRILVRPQTAMVGREHERQTLIEQLQQLAGGTSGLVVIEGEAGIGKSRLVAELQQQAQGLAIDALLGWGDAIEKTTPYHAWRPIFTQLFEIEPLADSLDTQRKRVLLHLESAPELLELMPLINAVLPLDLPDNQLTRQLSGEGRANKTAEFLVRILQRQMAGNPLLLILEDAHWLDSASWALARLAGLDVHPLLLVFATRPISEPLPKEYREFRQRPDLIYLPLEHLPPDAISQMVCTRLGVDELPDAVATLIRERAEGHPFFSEELAYALRDAGLISIEDRVCRVTTEVGDLSAIDFPDTVQGVIASRIDRLTPQQQLTLKVASVIGRVFAHRILHDVHPIEADKPHLADYLSNLEQLDITPLETPPPDLAYIFKHIITQEVAYNLMLFAQRQQLHQAVAEWYEDHHADDLSPYYPLLAHHWNKAEVAAKTIDYLEQAGAQALENGSDREAVNFLQQAIELDTRHNFHTARERRALWERQLGQAHYNLSQFDKSREHLHAALALLGWPVPATRAGLAAGLLQQMLLQLAHRLLPGYFIGRRAAQQTALLEASQALLGLAVAAALDGDLLSFTHATFQGLNLAEAASPSAKLAEGYATTALFFGVIPIHSLANRYFHYGQETLQRQPDIASEIRLRQLQAVYAAGLGRWDEAEAFNQVGLDTLGQIGEYRALDEARSIWGMTNLLRGNFALSREVYLTIYESGRHRGDLQMQVWGRIGLADLRLGKAGHLKKEAAWLADILSQQVAGLISVDIALVRVILALFHLHLGNLESARQIAQAVYQMTTNEITPTIYYFVHIYDVIPHVYLTLWENQAAAGQPTAEAREFARLSCKKLHNFARIFPVGRPAAWLWQGLYDWLSGKPGRAHKAWQKSLAHAQQLDMPWDQGRAHYEIARHLPPTDPTRHQHFQQAIAIFERLGAGWELTQARKALAAN